MRYLFIDNLRGLAFIFMVIHHIFYFKDVANDYSTSYADNKLVETSGMIARTLFIILAGLSLSITDKKNNKKSLKKRLNRTIEILTHALIITAITYVYYPDIFIRFGVLHFIGIATLLGSFFVNKKKLTLLFILIFILLKPISVNNQIIDTITGAKIHFSSMDYFPLFPWFGLLLIGLFIGQNVDLKLIEKKMKYFNNDKLIGIGQNCLNLYTGHIILLLVIYNLKNNLCLKK